MPSESTLSPTAIHGLHALSFLLSIMILVVSIQDCGILSLCLNPFFATLTVAYHVATVTIAYRNFKMAEDAPVLPSIWLTIAAYLLCLGWLGAYVSMAVVHSSQETQFTLFDSRIMIPQNMRNNQKFQIMFDAIECVTIGTLAVKNTIARRRMCKANEMCFFD